MRTAFTVTAVNCACWKMMAMRASSLEAAALAFRDWLNDPTQRQAESDEYNTMLDEYRDLVAQLAWNDAGEPPQRDDYRYVFDAKTIEPVRAVTAQKSESL